MGSNKLTQKGHFGQSKSEPKPGLQWETEKITAHPAEEKTGDERRSLSPNNKLRTSGEGKTVKSYLQIFLSLNSICQCTLFILINVILKSHFRRSISLAFCQF